MKKINKNKKAKIKKRKKASLSAKLKKKVSSLKSGVVSRFFFCVSALKCYLCKLAFLFLKTKIKQIDKTNMFVLSMVNVKENLKKRLSERKRYR